MTAKQGNKGPAILLVEDRQGYAEELIAGLRDEGYRVEMAGTAEDAIHALESVRYAAVLLDIELPLGESSSPRIVDGTPAERAGLEVLRYVRSTLGMIEMPIVVVSGLDHRAFWSNMVHELQSEKMHVTAIVSKPTGPRQVIRELARVTGWQGPIFRAFRDDDPSYGD